MDHTEWRERTRMTHSDNVHRIFRPGHALDEVQSTWFWNANRFWKISLHSMLVPFGILYCPMAGFRFLMLQVSVESCRLLHNCNLVC